MAAARGGKRAWLLVPLGALVVLSSHLLSLCTISFQDAEVEGGGAARTARKAKALRSLARFVVKHHGQAVGGAYDTNAIGEAWGGSAMHHWVDRAGADSTAEKLEQELMSMRIGRKAGTNSRRMAMHAKRLARQQQLQNRELRPENGMLHWADRPAAIESPENLEAELVSTSIGGLRGNEGQREAMRLRRLARQRELEGATFRQPSGGRRAKMARLPRGPWRASPALASSHYDTGALGESFRASDAGVTVYSPDVLEQELMTLKIGRESAAEGRRQASSARRAARRRELER